MAVTHLTQSQIAGLLGFSAVVWMIDVTKIRFTGHYCYVTSWRRVGTLLATIPLAFSVIVFTQKFFGIHSTQMLSAVTIVSATTLLLHGVAITWFPHLYENETIKRTNPRLATVLSRMGAGWVLYGTGLCLAMAVVIR